MASWINIKDRRPPAAGTYEVLAQLDDGTVVEQTDYWHVDHRNGWWGDSRDPQPGTVVAWLDVIGV